VEENTQKTGNAVTWEFRIPLVNNPHIMLDFAKVLGISGLISILLVSAMGFLVGDWEPDVYLEFTKGMLLVVAGLAVLMILIMLIWFGNKFYAVFSVDADGASYNVGRKQSKVNTAIAIIGALAGKPGVAGAGLLAKSQESGFFGWDMVYKVIYFPNSRVISLKNTWRTVVRLYCTEENYEEVRAIVQAGFEGAATARANALVTGAKNKSALVHRIFSIWTLMALVGAFITLANPVVDMDVYGWWMVLTGLLVLLSGVFAGCISQIMAIAGLLGTIWMIIITCIAGSAKTTIIPGLLTSSKFAMNSDGQDGVFLMLSIVGMILQLICSIRNIRNSDERQKTV
jgi:hypothetical protein